MLAWARRRMIIVDDIGWRAEAALARSGGEARVLAPMSTSTWLVAGGELVWLGAGGALHPRAIVAAAASPAVAGEIVRLDATAARPWGPAMPAADPHAARTAAAAARRRGVAVEEIGPPDGLARLLAPGTTRALAGAVGDILAQATGPVAALATACDADRASDAVEPALALLGLGAGLTPSGDDLVGGVFFARRWLGAAGVADAAGWRAAAETIRAAAHDRTHRISAALLGDLLDGDSYAPLHDVLAALAAGDDDVEAARRLTRLGHSSGWDMLAGLLVGLAPR